MLTHLSAFDVLFIATQLCRGLAVLHEHNIVHRDLSLRNVFVHRNEAGELLFKIGGEDVEFVLSRLLYAL